MTTTSEEPLHFPDAPLLAPRGHTPPPGYSHFPHWLLAVLLIGPWLLVAGLVVATLVGPRVTGIRLQPGISASTSSSTITPSPNAELGKPGRWGQLEYRTIRIELPDEFVFVPQANQPPVRWFFASSSKDQAIQFLKDSGVAPAQLNSIQKASWKSEASGVVAEPGDEFILSLSPNARSKIYSRLVEFPENSRYVDPVWFEKGQVDERIKDSGMAQASIDLLKSLLYSQGPSLLLFADFEPALRRLPNDHERHLFMNAVSRKRTLLAGLCINRDSNLEEIVNYWGINGRKKNVAPLIRALRHEGEAKINIICLLPDFPRDHVYLHPFAGTAEQVGHTEDCFWSAINFFNEPPDNRVNDMNYLKQLLQNDYGQINQPSQLGDVLLLETPNHSVIHAAAYVADDVVFTKNGESYTQPWIFMHMNDMLSTYAVKYPHSGPLKVLCYRKKSLF